MHYPFDADAGAKAFQKISEIVSNVPLYPELSNQVEKQIDGQFQKYQAGYHDTVQAVEQAGGRVGIDFKNYVAEQFREQLALVHTKINALPSKLSIADQITALEKHMKDHEEFVGNQFLTVIECLQKVHDKIEEVAKKPEGEMKYPVDPKQLVAEVTALHDVQMDQKIQDFKWKAIAMVFGSGLISSAVAFFVVTHYMAK